MSRLLDTSGNQEEAARSALHDSPQLLTELDPWARSFFRNLADTLSLREPEPLPTDTTPGAYWPDVFVRRGLPWTGFAQSALYHSLTVALVFAVTQAWQHRIQPMPVQTLAHESITYVPMSDYLPPLQSGARPSRARKGQPEHAKQRIISVPPEPDNRTQTIVTPPDIKLKQEVPLPNIVAWTPMPTAPIAAGASRSLTLPTVPVVAPPPELGQLQRNRANLGASVVAPTPDVAGARSERAIAGLQASVVAPAPSVGTSVDRRLSDINIGHSAVVAPTPQLPMDAQRVSQGRTSLTGGGAGGGQPQVVPPPPSADVAGGTHGSGRLVALGIHPVEIKGPIQPPAGNRRGEFAATPEGKPGAPGTPDIVDGSDHGSGAGGGAKGTSGLPPGLSVSPPPPGATSAAVTGKGPDTAPSRSTVNPALLASVTPPRISAPPAKAPEPVASERVTETDRRVFGGRKVYSMRSNMPNLNSAGGSWVIRYAELQQSNQKGDLTAPVPVRQIDPGYPMELMRQNVEGTVTLRAVIHSDGKVGNIVVVNSSDERLEALATTALSRWQFEPATRDGVPVDLDALVLIPFKARKNAF
jgi:TonB family protein